MRTLRIFYLSACLILSAFFLQGGSAPTPIKLVVDATQVQKGLFHADLTIPSKPGPLTLLYPKWIPGEHGPTGPIANLTGIVVRAAGKRLPWRRDPLEMFAFHCNVPEGANSVELSLDFLAPVETNDFSAGGSTTDKLAMVSWNQVLLYPQGARADELTFDASLRLPPGWRYGTSLPVESESEALVDFAPASLETLIDSPVLTGVYFRTIPLTSPPLPPAVIDLAADSTAALQVPPQTIDAYKKLAAEAGALFGAQHYQTYHFLLTLSDHVAHFGLEHHQSSDNRVPERTLTDPRLRTLHASLMPHEFVHSWNGKYRRPAGMVTGGYEEPIKTGMLWVYEGLTTYLGNVLATRSGLWSPEQYKEDLALSTAVLNHEPGREWRSLSDTAVAAQVLYDAPKEGASWRRGVDFYDEGALVWLEADAIIRRETRGRRSLDDFCRLFFGGKSGPPAVVPYTLDDVVSAMNSIAAYDWRGFFQERLDAVGEQVLSEDVAGSGWQVGYSDKENEFLSERDEEEKIADLRYSVGLLLKEDGSVIDSVRGMPADKAGIAPGMKVVAVNGRAWSAEVVREALKPGKNGYKEIELEFSNKGFYRKVRLNYVGGNKYPHLEREAGKPDFLGEILQPRTK